MMEMVSRMHAWLSIKPSPSLMRYFQPSGKMLYFSNFKEGTEIDFHSQNWPSIWFALFAFGEMQCTCSFNADRLVWQLECFYQSWSPAESTKVTARPLITCLFRKWFHQPIAKENRLHPSSQKENFCILPCPEQYYSSSHTQSFHLTWDLETWFKHSRQRDWKWRAVWIQHWINALFIHHRQAFDYSG